MGDALSEEDHENLIERIIGREAYLALCDWSGGISLYVPSSLDTASGQHLCEEIGQEAADKLVQWAGGSTIAVPSRNDHAISRRRRELRTMRRRGMTVQEIARIYRYEGRYTERQIYRLLSEDNA
jgi:hypothetical protein